jgi:cytochrome c5
MTSRRRARRSGAVLGTAFGLLVLGAAALPAQRDDARGERIMNASCQACHDTRRIQTQAMDAEQWTKTIETMQERGAKVSREDLPVLVDYLVDNHGPLPNGAGKAILLNTCTLCHDLKRIKFGRRSAEEWEETLISMLNEGAPLSDETFPVVHAYLTRHFGAD